MNAPFEFRVRWLERTHGSAAEREAFGELEIRWGDIALTELEDIAAATVRPAARVSVYHPATWLAANWWRLRWEPIPDAMDTDWRLAHELGGAGGGFAWPSLRLAADGENITFTTRQTLSAGPPVRYLRDADGVIAATTFERAVDDLLARVLARLTSRHADAAELPEMWGEVCRERRDPALASFRRREALLGLDPDGIDAAALTNVLSGGAWMGAAALDETLAAARAARIAATLDGLCATRHEPGATLDVTPFFALQEPWQKARRPADEPWRRGAHLAEVTRAHLGLGADEAVAFHLPDLLGHDVTKDAPSRGPFAVGFRSRDAAKRVTFHGVRRHPTSRRFEAARLLADALDSPAADTVLPVTEAATARQKFQRAFAQEFLCPATALSRRMPLPVPSDGAIEEAADHFGVAEHLVRSALVNHGLVDRGYLPGARGA